MVLPGNRTWAFVVTRPFNHYANRPLTCQRFGIRKNCIWDCSEREINGNNFAPSASITLAVKPHIDSSVTCVHSEVFSNFMVQLNEICSSSVIYKNMLGK